MKSSSEISPTLQPHPLLQLMTSFLRAIDHGDREIKEKSGNLVRQNCSLPTPRMACREERKRIVYVRKRVSFSAAHRLFRYVAASYRH